ncbi:unnamed protein product [Toxocara canis]|uniref:Uncharacterized protein n=1 Tax=Toxocara canis TaxID=6265 RepID=A0A3P7H1N0_TOXCA|nr:unnamed protein product [Toxocara canis]
MPSTPRPVDESDVATDRITIEQQATQYEQMRAHHAVAHSEPARRIEKKLTDAALDPHASRRKEQLPSTSRSDDELEVLINGRPIEHHEDNVERKRAAYASKNRRKWRGPKRRRIFRRPPIDSSDSLDLPLQSTSEKLAEVLRYFSYPAVLFSVNKDPRVDEENAIILHPTLNRPLEKEEINIYIARTILRLKTDHITKSHIRMLAPGWMQIADDTDIMNAIEELRTSGLLVVKEDDKTRKQKVDVYKKAGSKDRVDIQPQHSNSVIKEASVQVKEKFACFFYFKISALKENNCDGVG